MEDLGREWAHERHLRWVIDTTRPARGKVVEPPPVVWRWQLEKERDAILATIPPDPTAAIRAVERDKVRLRAQRRTLQAGGGRYADQPIGQAVRDLRDANQRVADLEASLRNPASSRRDRRRLHTQLERWGERRSSAEAHFGAVVGPEERRLNTVGRNLDAKLAELRRQAAARQSWSRDHPAEAERLRSLQGAIAAFDRPPVQPSIGRDMRRHPTWGSVQVPARELGIDLGR